MKSITESMVKRLAYEERLCLYRLVSGKNKNLDFNSKKLDKILFKVADLTEITVNDKNFNFENIWNLGLENCCNYFLALCEQYKMFKDSSEEFSDYNANQRRVYVVIALDSYDKNEVKSDIGLYEAAEKIDEVVQYNFDVLQKESLSNNFASNIMILAIMSTFFDMYYQLRDIIEGKSYYDGRFMNEYRELPLNYENSSDELLSAIAKSKEMSVKDVKEYLINKLDRGITDLVIATKFIQNGDIKHQKL